MRFLVLLIVLAFPVIDVLATLRFARWTGVPAVGVDARLDGRRDAAVAP